MYTMSAVGVVWALFEFASFLVVVPVHLVTLDSFVASLDRYSLVEFILAAAALLLFVPSFVYFIECLIAIWREDPPSLQSSHSISLRNLAVLVPAHNEEHGIGDTVRHLSAHLTHEHRLIVVADNCTDDTAIEAGRAGAEVWTRSDIARRGKGYAISFALDRLASRPPDVVVLVDADCRIAEGGLEVIAKAALAYRRPVQARYLLSVPSAGGSLACVSALAFLIRNLVRPLGMTKIGMPCHLTGSGMAFPWDQIRSAPHQHGNLVEDLVMGLELSIAGFPPLFAPEVAVDSELPASKPAAVSQRRRWEHGQLATLLNFGPRLMREACRQRRPDLAALAADLIVPPLALLIVLLFATGLLAAPAAFAGASIMPLSIILADIGLVAVATMVAWAKYGRSLVPISGLLLAPVYLAWKVPIYAAFFFRRRQTEWVRTSRSQSEVPDISP